MSKNGNKIGGRKGSIDRERKATPKNSVHNSRKASPLIKSTLQRQIIGSKTRPSRHLNTSSLNQQRGSITSNKTRDSNYSQNSKKSAKSKNSKLSKKAKQSATIGYKIIKDLPSLEERRRSRERLGISSYLIDKRRSSLDSMGSRGSRSSKNQYAKQGQSNRPKSKGNNSKKSSTKNVISLFSLSFLYVFSNIFLT